MERCQESQMQGAGNWHMSERILVTSVGRIERDLLHRRPLALLSPLPTGSTRAGGI